jgi:phosphoribosylanthranilate isomerase
MRQTEKCCDGEGNRGLAQGFPQVKICGLTRVDQALACVDLGAAAIGFVFFAKSPRNVCIEKARTMAQQLPREVARVGVFVDEPYDVIMQRVEACGLTCVQLHGRETPELVMQLKSKGVRVIKSLFTDRSPHLAAAARFAADAYLAECGAGPLPGGNAKAWNYADAGDLGQSHPLILAGGLSLDNVSHAIQSACPDAVDVSSGVEARPGLKDMVLVKQFMQAVMRNKHNNPLRRIF